jgi:hypothetical protein
MKEDDYLTNIPELVNQFGFCKTLIVRKEIIHIKHIFTEIFVRKTIDIQKYLNLLDISLFEYIEIMTNRIRKIHNFSRNYDNDCNKIVKSRRGDFFNFIDLTSGLKRTIVLDFDGVITKNKFKELYNICCEREEVQICSANPTITFDWFEKYSMNKPNQIHSMKGKVKKIKRLIEIQKKYDFMFYIDDEIEYLEYAWIFGIQTFHWNENKIKYFTMKTK